MHDPFLVRGRWVVTGAGPDDPTLQESALLIAGGKIAARGAWPDLRRAHPGLRVIGSERVAVMPGLINAHHHSAGASALQHGLPDMLLEPWILAHARMRPSDFGLGVLLSAGRLLRSGVTSVVDVVSGRGPAASYAERLRGGLKAYAQSGMRVAYAAGFSDQSFLVHGTGQDEAFLASLPADLRDKARSLLPRDGDMDQQDYFAVMEEILRDYHDHELIEPWFAPPGPQWVSDPFLQEIAERAATHDVGIQTHLCESFYEKLHGPRYYGKSALTHLRDLGILSPRFSIAHGVWLGASDIEVLCETGCAVSHNPSSNLRLRAGIAPLRAFLAAGATAALGMDGTTLSDDEDMFTEMRLALRLQATPLIDEPTPAPREVFSMATLGGAKLLRREGLLGRLAEGYAADLVLVDLERITWPWVAPECDVRDLILMRAQAGDVAEVLVNGETVLKDGQPTRFDIREAGREFAERLAREAPLNEASELVEALIPRLEAFYGAWDVPALDPYTRYNSRI
jgi:cytosine/adenosine deaminase-related metal-dependent hydrolase